MGEALHILLEKARDDAEVARIISERHGALEEQDIADIRLWLDRARNQLNRAEDHLDMIEENR